MTQLVFVDGTVEANCFTRYRCDGCGIEAVIELSGRDRRHFYAGCNWAMPTDVSGRWPTEAGA